MFKFGPACLIYVTFLAWRFEKNIWSYDKLSYRSEVDDLWLPDVILGDIAFENIVFIRVLESILTLVV